VRENERVDIASVQTVMKHEKLAWLTLVTCEDYRARQSSYNARRMVRAVLVKISGSK
jgi:sortase (surface protein transpeptidase)